MNTTELDNRLIQLSTGAKGLRAELPVAIAADPHDSDILHMRASDETLDRYQEVIVASGWRLENYRRNPVIQNAHQYGDIIFTIGQALKTWVSGKELLQTWKFAAQENPFAKIARDLYRGGYLRAASVGFVPIRWEDGHSPGSAAVSGAAERVARSAFRRRYLEQELLEVSAVGIPANPNALALAVKDGAVEKSDLRALAQVIKHFCNDSAGLAADARAPGRETNGAQWLQLVREVKELAERS